MSSDEIKKAAPLAVVLIAVLAAILIAVPVFERREASSSPARVANDVAVNVSLIQLIASPEKFDGRRVVVSGFLVNESGDRALYIGANDAINGLDNKVAVSFVDSDVPPDLQEELNREYVALRGIFKGGSQPELGGIDHLEERHGPVQRPPLGE